MNSTNIIRENEVRGDSAEEGQDCAEPESKDIKRKHKAQGGARYSILEQVRAGRAQDE